MTFIINRYKGLLFISLVFSTLSINAQETYQQEQNHALVNERKFDYFFYEGINLKNAEKFDAAFEMFKHCLSIDSTSSAVYYELSSFYANLDQSEKAVEYMKKAIAHSPDNEEYRGTLAVLLFNLGMYREAADEYEILAKAHPEKTELLYYLAETYSRIGEIGKAIDMYNEMENVIGMNEALFMEKYQLYMKLQQEEKALNEIKLLADKFPEETRYTILLGDLYLQKNDNKQALHYYQKAYETDPGSPYYPASMANYYEKLGQSDSAKQQINAALKNERLDINTKLTIIARYINQLQSSKQDIEGVDALFQTLLVQHPDESRLKMVYGMYLSTLKKFDEARFQVQLVTESDPENLEAWQQLLQFSLQTRDFDEVIRICKKCHEIFPESLEFRDYLGIAYYQKKEYQAAIETYKETIPLIPAGNGQQISYFYGNIGDTYFKMKETDKAFAAYEEALRHNDKNIMVLNNYAYYLSLLQKDLTKAERMSALTIKMEPNNATYIDTYAWIFFKQGNFILAKMYMEQALSRDRTNSAELRDHYGDILYFIGEKDKAVEQWMKAKELGKNTATVNKKIEEKTFFEETKEELFYDIDENTTEMDQ